MQRAGAARRRGDEHRRRPTWACRRARLHRRAAAAGDDEPDRDAIEPALARAGGVVAQAAAELGLSRQALYRRMERLGIARGPTDERAAGAAAAWRWPRCGAGRHRSSPRWSALAVLLGDVARRRAAAGRRSLALLVAVPLVAVAACAAQFAPMLSLFRALAGTVTSYRDGDFSFSLRWHAQRRAGRPGRRAQRARRRAARAAPGPGAARAAARHHGAEHAGGDAAGRPTRGPIVYANLAARQLLNDGRRLEGHALDDAAARRAAQPLREALARGGDGLFTVGARATSEEIYHLARRSFRLNGRAPRAAAAAPADRRAAPPGSADLEEGDPRHQPRAQQLAGADRVAGALGRRAGAARPARAPAERIFATIEERARHLEGFIRGYARFAKLPTPRARGDRLARLPRRGCAARCQFALDGAAARRQRAASIRRSSSRRCSTC